jgi:hypothetical protein
MLDFREIRKMGCTGSYQSTVVTVVVEKSCEKWSKNLGWFGVHRIGNLQIPYFMSSCHHFPDPHCHFFRPLPHFQTTSVWLKIVSPPEIDGLAVRRFRSDPPQLATLPRRRHHQRTGRSGTRRRSTRSGWRPAKGSCASSRTKITVPPSSPQIGWQLQPNNYGLWLPILH